MKTDVKGAKPGDTLIRQYGNIPATRTLVTVTDVSNDFIKCDDGHEYSRLYGRRTGADKGWTTYRIYVGSPKEMQEAKPLEKEHG